MPKRPRRKLDVALEAPRSLTLTLKVGPLAPVVAVAFHPDGKLLAVGSYGQVTVWDLTKATPATTLTSVLGAVNDLRFSPDGKLLAVGGGQPSAKGDLRLFTVADWKLDGRPAGPRGRGGRGRVPARRQEARLGELRPDRPRLGRRRPASSSGRSRRIRTSSTPSPSRPTASTSSPAARTAPPASARPTPATGKLTFSDREEDVLGVAVHPDGKSIVVSGREPALMWWNPETGVKIRSVGGHRGAVHEIAFSRDGKSLVSGGDDGTARVWDGTTGALKQTITVGPIVYAVAISPDGKTVAAGCFDGLTRLYDAATGARAARCSRSTRTISRFSPSGYVAASDGLIPLGRWTDAGKPISADVAWKTLRQPALVLKASPGKRCPRRHSLSELTKVATEDTEMNTDEDGMHVATRHWSYPCSSVFICG